MTFISGLSLYFNLSRHVFGAVQQVLFPKYFSLNSFLSLITLISFSHLSQKTEWDFNQMLQTSVLITCFLLELLIRLYIVPPVIHLISVKTKIEATAGVGQEVGYCDPGALKNCPYYTKLHSQFRRLHMIVAVGNICTMVCSALHLHSLALQWTCL
uniref:TMEM205-like domain-containing protein n=1 Tax=Clastoptera arizonana TaxID=38151 RepID=A0A1B6CNU1_9HEMI